MSDRSLYPAPVKWFFVIWPFVLVLIFVHFGVGCANDERRGQTEEVKTTTLGRAPFSIQHRDFHCDEFLASFAGLPTINIAFLWQTFGESTECLDRVLADARTDIVEGHLTNGTCDRLGRSCAEFELKAGLNDEELSKRVVARDQRVLGRFRAVAREYREWAAGRIPTCLVSPMLEADLTQEAGRVLVGVTREELPGCLVVWNPLRGHQDVGQDLTEVHGLGVVSEVANNDGEVIGNGEYREYLARNRGSFIRFVWGFSDNCLTEEDVAFVTPRERDCSGQPSAFSSLGLLLAGVYRNEQSE